MSQKKRILVTNDDGISAPGIKALVHCMQEYGTVKVAAPDRPMSGTSHAITMRNPVMVDKTNHFQNIESYTTSGTPADCVKYAIGNLFGDELPDLLVSGINHGSNASVNMLYSGTVAAAVEGALYGVPSIAFSSLNYEETDELEAPVTVVHQFMEFIENKNFPRFVLFNVNVPDIPLKELKGFKLCRQSMGYWKEEFTEEADLNGKKSFWLKGEFMCQDKEEDTDIWALENGYASVVPVYLDLTAHSFLNELQKQKKHERI